MATLALFLTGIVLLIAGADALVRGASRLAARMGLSPLVIGLTVVAFGTSSPELAVSVQAGLGGQGDIALGNVVGSNIFNVLFILGLSATITPLAVAQRLVRIDVPLLIAASVLVLILALDGSLGRIDGLVLAGGIVAYITLLFAQSRQETEAVRAEYEHEFGSGPNSGPGTPIDVTRVLGGLGMLVLGSRWLVGGAVSAAEALGVSELVVALTIIAAGTSLPEVATSVLASIRGERDIAVGNVLGSCVFNLLAILGITGLVAGNGIQVAPSTIGFDLPIMITVSVACLPILFTGHRIDRWEGMLFLGYYVAYTLYLILDATKHDALREFSAVMGLFVIPLTLVTLAVLGMRALGAHRAGTR